MATAHAISFEDTEVSLVTVGPGAVYWQAFGHNAILVNDPVSGFSAIYNFGIFDFYSENFLLKFVQGLMSYRMEAYEPGSDIAAYVRDKRSVTIQRLNLSSEQKRELIDFLEWHRRPENAAYRYDYFRQNCSSKVRDAIDRVLGGALRRSFEVQDAEQTFRSSLNEYSKAIPWMHLGINLALGYAIDQPISRWELFYLPEHFSQALSEDYRLPSGEPLVAESRIINNGSNGANPWPAAALLLMLFLVVSTFLVWHFPWAASAWALTSGLLGIVLLLLWFVTDHWAAAANPMIGGFSPLLLAWPWLKGRRRRQLTIIVLAGLAASTPFARGFAVPTALLCQALTLLIALRAHGRTAS